MSQQTLLITGATSDLGYMYLKTIQDKTLKIVALYFDYEARLDELIKTYGLNIDKVRVDFTQKEQIESLKNLLTTHYTITKVMHLAAPSLKQERFNKMTLDDFEINHQIQVTSIVEILKCVLPQMKKQKEGNILFVLSSVVLNKPPKFWSAYTTYKYALLGLMKSLVAEYAMYNIRINAISPSMMETKFIQSMDERMVQKVGEESVRGKHIELDEVVQVLGFLDTIEGGALNGVNLPITGGDNY